MHASIDVATVNIHVNVSRENFTVSCAQSVRKPVAISVIVSNLGPAAGPATGPVSRLFTQSDTY